MQSAFKGEFFIVVCLVKKEAYQIQKLYNIECLNLSVLSAYCRSNMSAIVHGHAMICLLVFLAHTIL